MKTFCFRAFLVLALVFSAGLFTAQAQTGWGFQQYFVPAGSEASGYPIVTATVPVGSYIVTWGSTYQPDGNGGYNRVAGLTYITPLSPNPQPQETHYYIAGICQGIKAPSGYRKLATYRNIYGLDNPDTGYDNVNEYCLVEVVPR